MLTIGSHFSCGLISVAYSLACGYFQPLFPHSVPYSIFFFFLSLPFFLSFLLFARCTFWVDCVGLELHSILKTIPADFLQQNETETKGLRGVEYY